MVDRGGNRGLDRFIIVADPDGPRVLRDEAAALVISSSVQHTYILAHPPTRQPQAGPLSKGFEGLKVLPRRSGCDGGRGCGLLPEDRGVLGVMAKHKWKVGLLKEFPPADGKVGVDAQCLLGYNKNMSYKTL